MARRHGPDWRTVVRAATVECTEVTEPWGSSFAMNTRSAAVSSERATKDAILFTEVGASISSADEAARSSSAYESTQHERGAELGEPVRLAESPVLQTGTAIVEAMWSLVAGDDGSGLPVGPSALSRILVVPAWSLPVPGTGAITGGACSGLNMGHGTGLPR